MVAECEASGMGRGEFCRKHGLSSATLARYRKWQRQAEGEATGANRWVAVELRGARPAAGSGTGSGLSVALPGGRRIEVGRGFDAGSPVTISRDALGNALGGIHLPQHAVPTATNTGVNSSLCRVLGTYQSLDDATLRTLYRDHGAYVSAVVKAAAENLLKGSMLMEDAIATIAEASNSEIGHQLPGGDR